LVRDDAETSLCAIRRGALGPFSDSDNVVCPECLDWLPKGTRFSEEYRKVQQKRAGSF